MWRDGKNAARQAATRVVAAAAAMAAGGLTARAGVTGGTGQEFVISTSGATALSAFTRAGDGSVLNRGPYSLGQDALVIGGSTYTLDATGQRIGRGLLNNPLANEPPLSADRIVYHYHEIGSVNGVNDVAQAGGLLPATNFATSSGNPFWHMGTRLNAAPANGTVLSNGYTWQGKQPVRIAWSDVRAEQAFSLAGAAAYDKRPTAAGYGLGRDLPAGGTNYQKLTSAGSLVGGVEASTTRLRNEDLAVVPFTISANPGTGLSRVSEEDAQWLSATGRMRNGANFNFTTRDIGSGTRNQAGNNLRLDPSWAAGERDRIDAATGQERDPFDFVRNDDRPSAEATFGDKTSGSSRLRNVVIHSRMALGVLSSGDVGSRGRSTASTEPIRVLAVDWQEAGGEADGGYVQPTLANVVDGRYQMWSAAQAVTVSPYANPAANDAGANAYRPIQGDTNDQDAGGATSAAQPGVHRKFLDNIKNSIANFGNAETNQTPFDAIAAASFVPTQVMKVRKGFDGDTQHARPLNASEQAALDTLLGQDPSVSSNLVGALNWTNAGGQNGNLASNSLRYNVFAPGNNGLSDTVANSNASADLSVDIEQRTVLAGDFDGDGVRDAGDVKAMAMAYAAPAAYLATPAAGDAKGRNYNGAEVASPETATASKAALTFAAGQEGLVVLSDLNGNGNVTPTSATTGAVASVERADVKFFLYGAAVDTQSANPATGYAGSSDPAVRRADGVRLGRLTKNAAIDEFDAELDALAVDGLITPVTAAALKFDKFDVNGDGVRDRLDAKIVDRNVGKDYRRLTDVLGTFDDLVAAELNDTGDIDLADFGLVRAALGGALLPGDSNFDGAVNFVDLLALAKNYNRPVGRWSLGDFDLSGGVNFVDLLALAKNYNTAAPGGVPGASAAFNAEVGAAFAAAAVPEPASLGVVLLAGSTLIGRRRRRA